MAEASRLEIRKVSKSYNLIGQQPGQQRGQQRLDVLSDIELSVEAGAFVSIVGPSGCGKSTLLRLVAGLDGDYRGDILLHGERVTGPSLSRGIVFQDHRLLPWLTLEDNIALSLENSGWSKARRAEAIRSHIALVGLNGFEKAWPHQLSGGMAQRGAIARGLVGQPEILLLDEPLGALDALTRLRLQEELQRIWRVEGVTMILVTHDVDEAIFLSDTVVVMSANPGRIVREFAVDIARPRERSSHAFSELKGEILAAMGDSIHAEALAA
ncbi:ABC transporter ATP-binding protein [Thauera butanivorans]|uniref:ABC transporter ATP-binding protein n=1 Tax=Thauera butanivorans TaxID=86174 RepID=UPI003AB89B72